MSYFQDIIKSSITKKKWEGSVYNLIIIQNWSLILCSHMLFVLFVNENSLPPNMIFVSHGLV